MRRAVAAVATIGMVVAGCGDSGDTSGGSPPTETPAGVVLPPGDELQATLDAGVRQHGGKGFTFAVIMADGTRWVGASGVSHGTTEITPDMPFAAGSITKTWTAATILQLADEGVLDLEDTVAEWLPAYPNVDGSITIRQLLNHTSGIYNYTDHPDYWQSVVWDEPGRTWTPAETITTFQLQPYFEPGAGWHYSNSGYALLRTIITEATGSDIATVYRARFFDPLGLDGTVVVPAEELPANTAHGWWDLDGDGAYDDFSATPYTAFASGVGGQVFATAEDLAEWIRALYHERRVLSPSAFDEMVDFRPVRMEEEPLLAGYGLGSVRFAREVVSGKEAWGHGGNAPGYAAGAFYLPEYGITMGFADNTERGDAMPLLDDMMGLILGTEFVTPQ
jgi:D-alanyl-D-alanine carboxypeptidase